MTISQLIELLTDKLEQNGDLPVFDTDGHAIIGISVDTDCGCCAGQVFIEADF